MPETDFDRCGRELRVFAGGAIEGAAHEAWTRASNNPAGLAGDIAKNTLAGAGVGAMFVLAPEVAPALAVVAACTAVKETFSPSDEAGQQRNARIANIFEQAWNGNEDASTKSVAKGLGAPVFDFALAVGVGGFGAKKGLELTERKLAEIAANEMRGTTMSMKSLGEGTYKTRIGSCTTTTREDGTVVKEFDSGYTARWIPNNDGAYMFTERTPQGTLGITFPDGSRMLETASGRTYKFELDGSHEVVRPTGLKLNVSADGTRTYTHPNGTDTTYSTAGKERNVPPQK